MITTHEQGIRNAVTVTAELICNDDASLEVDHVQALLRELSITVGTLDPALYRGLFDENPLRDRPFLEKWANPQPAPLSFSPGNL